MMERKDQKAYSMEDFQFAHETLIGTRHGEVLDAGEKIHKFVLMSNKGLKISKGAQPWKSYVDYIAGIVVEGLSKVSPSECALVPATPALNATGPLPGDAMAAPLF